ncbi:MAG: DNA repair protein RadA [Ignavibacteria bacterium]|nr:DNA repair protein RadA [Ignavibacteria bacterium]MBK8383439.1 DNA repair protein RadA [Ignavibacteria bacterium]MBK9403265.1 DNA repair protein RadA [Ignavibacteria bacterium]
MSKVKTKYVCQNCGYSTLRWSGKCPDCDTWSSLVEEIVTNDKKRSSGSGSLKVNEGSYKLISEISSVNESRTQTHISELDRVLGGGIVGGSVILIGGDPGIGKSTLMLQLAEQIKDKKILYVSGEESASQIKLRADRLNYHLGNFYILSETNMEIIEAVIEKESPDIVVVDSIQTVYRPEIESAPGTVSQLRESSALLMHIAKKNNVAVFIVGHITKDGMIAGPKVLEHMVDVVLQFEGERTHSYRILRGIKNRFGSTNEIGIFEMTDMGLKEVLNPSEVFLSQRNYGASGCVISASIEGTRPILIEVQALVTSSNFGIPQRTSMGFDYKKLSIIIAVIEKKLGVVLSKSDIFINIAGGIKIDEPAIDLAVAMSIYSSFRDIPVDSETVVLGEIGLSGEIRTISYIDRRITEAAKLGFKRIIIPKGNMKNLNTKKYKAEVTGVEKIREAIEKLV